MWENSTLETLVYWAHGSRSQGGRARMQINASKLLPVPDLRQIPRVKLRAAAGRFAALATRELLPLAKMHSDPARHAIDKAVMKMLDLPYNEREMRRLREAFCAEPSVGG